MCLDFPGRVVDREGDQVVIETDGRRRRASTLLYPELEVGDWVYVAAGTVIDRLEPSVAQSIIDELTAAKGAAL